MRTLNWIGLALLAAAHAQSTVTVCESYNYTATSTFIEFQTFYISVDARGGTRTFTLSQQNTRSSVTSIRSPISTLSSTVSSGGTGGSWTTSSTSSSRSLVSDNVPGNGTSVVIPDNTITPITPIPTSSTTISSTLTSTTTVSSSSESSSSTSDTTSSEDPAPTTSTTTSESTSFTQSTTPSSSAVTTSTSSKSTTISTTTIGTTATETTTTTIISSSISTSIGAVVTNRAYIDTVLRHHNQHRLNHSSPALSWSSALAEAARKIADSCVYAHDTATDCTPDGTACYGQNIGAGYLPTQMSFLISDGFYNSEVNSYTYYGGEPDLDTLHEWGHFSQIVWKTDTTSVGCYTMDCSDREGQLTFPNGGGRGIRPFFTVCNYGGPGNWVDEFTENVIRPIGLPTIKAGYLCPTLENCEDGSVP